MNAADDETVTHLYRGVKIEGQYKGFEMRHGLAISKYSWVAQAPGWMVMAPSLDAIHEAVDSHLDRSDVLPLTPE